MNRILTTDGYRFCQSGYDTDGSTVLSVNHDPWGIALVYSGFVMFTVAGLWVLLSRRCRWRSLLRSLSLLAILASPGFMSASSVKGVPAEVADSLRSRQVVYQGRVVTFNTLSREVVAKLHGAPSYRGLSPRADPSFYATISGSLEITASVARERQESALPSRGGRKIRRD